MATKKELTKEDLIKKEITRLTGIFKDLEIKKKKTVEGLICESAFMRVTLEELKKLVNENGVIDEMPQGEYSILRESPYLKSYNAMIQRYTTVNDKLLSLLPKEEVKIANDGFEDFVNSREDI